MQMHLHLLQKKRPLPGNTGGRFFSYIPYRNFPYLAG